MFPPFMGWSRQRILGPGAHSVNEAPSVSRGHARRYVPRVVQREEQEETVTLFLIAAGLAVTPWQPALIQQGEGLSLISAPGACLDPAPGLPALPVYPVSVEGIPSPDLFGRCRWVEMSPSATLEPVWAPVPLCMPAPRSPGIRSPVWQVDSWWPARPFRVTGTGREGSVELTDLVVCPFRYDPVTGRLERLQDFDPGSPPTLSAGGGAGTLRMLIVTPDSLESIFLPLAARRYDEGIITTIAPVSEALSMPGRDDAEKLRNFVIQFREQNGLDFLLLGGDTDLVPFRKAWAMECGAGFHPREDSLPCDLYFADLGGTWDADGDGVYGELADSVDLYPDLAVGRAPVENSAEAEAFVAKTVAVEDCSLPGFFDEGLFAAMVLWNDPYTDSGVSKDFIVESSIPSSTVITRLYQSLGNESAEAVLSVLDQGISFVNHCGHAWFGSIGTGPDYITENDLDSVDSGGLFSSFLYSTGCWSAAFDFDAIAEHFVTSADGCGACWIGNSSYGWGSPGNPLYGYSDRFDQEIMSVFFSDRSLRMGQALASAKAYFVPLSRDENVYRWHQYDLNLLGDPSLLPPRSTPQEPVLCLPPFVTPFTVDIPVRVTGCSADGLRLCVHDEGDNYSTSTLDASGQEFVEFDHPVQGTVTVTVTGAGTRRTSEQIGQASGPLPEVSLVQVLEPGQPDPDGHLSPGEQDLLAIRISNLGTETAGQMSLKADLDAGPALLLSDGIAYGDIEPGQSSFGSDSLLIAVSTAASLGQIVTLHLELDWEGGSNGFQIPLLVSSPGLYIASWSVDDSAGGDGDGAADPGETVDLLLHLANFGLETASGISLAPVSMPPWLSLEQTGPPPDIPEGGTGDALFTAAVSAGAASPSFASIPFQIASGFWMGSDTLPFCAGATGLVTDVESGPDGWTSSGDNDLWRITTSHHHSGSHCWHCGNDPGYVPGMDCGLTGPAFAASTAPVLHFWATYETATFGVDGLYVIVHTGGAGADTLDFIGSGGALGMSPSGVGAGWTPFTYDLPMEAGDSATVEFRFVSDLDSSVGDGFYLDDVVVTGGWQGSPGQAGGQGGGEAPVMDTPFPSPCGGILRVELNLPVRGPWRLSVVDLSGRVVGSTVIDGPGRGLLSLDQSESPDGLYFLVLSGPARATGEFVLLKGR